MMSSRFESHAVLDGSQTGMDMDWYDTVFESRAVLGGSQIDL